MGKEKTLCRRCVLPGTALNAVIGRDGICNLCRAHESAGPFLGDYPYRKPLLQQRFEAVSGRQRYDALVGLSGGKDSSYVALRLARNHGLRLLLCTYDNGYLSESARQNIQHVAGALKQDHCFIGPGPELQSAIARASMRRFGLPCIGCTFPGILAVLKVAVERDIPFIVHGRSPAQMFKDLAPGSIDPFLPFLKGNFKPRDVEAGRKFVAAAARDLTRRFRWFLSAELRRHPGLREEARKLYEPDPGKLATQPDPPEFLAYFLYEPYDEKRLITELEHELQWRRPVDDRVMGHDDCLVHAAAVYLHTVSYGHPILQPELATMVRTGAMTREDALARLALEVEARQRNAQSMQALSSVSGLGADELLDCAAQSHRKLALLRLGLRWRQGLFGNLLRSPLAG